MKNDEEILASLIAGGLIGAALGALVTDKDKETGAVLGALVGAAMLATYKANERALQTNVPVYVEENGSLYELKAGSEKRFIRKIEKNTTPVPLTFKLK